MVRIPEWVGEILSIHIADTKEAPMRSVERVRAVPGKGLEGDRYFHARGTYSDRPDPSREVTLIESEAIDAMARDSKVRIAAGDARRNIVTRGVPLNHLVGQDFSIGDVILRGIRLCEPCTHLEGLTRKGVLGALVHRGGLRAQVVVEGVIRVGDSVRPMGPSTEAPATADGDRH